MTRLLRRLVEYYTLNMRLHTKLLISHMALVLVPTLVLTVFLYSYLYDALVTATIDSEQALTEQTVSAMDATLARVMNAASTVQDTISKEQLFRIDKAIPASQLRRFTESVQALVDGTVVTDIRIYASEVFENSTSFSVSNIIRPLATVQSSYWYGILSSDNTYGDGLLCPSLYLSPSETQQRGELAYISCLPYPTGGEPAVCIAVYFSQQSIDHILQQNLNVANSAAYIINTRDALVSTSSTALSGAYFMPNSFLTQTVGGMGHFTMGSYLGEDIYIGYYALGDTDWRLVSVLPASNLIRKGTIIVFGYAGFYLAFSLLALFLALALSRSITKRITLVVQQMKTVETGSPVCLAQPITAHDEIGVLARSYNSMANEINSLLQNEAAAAKALRLSEFRALQAQINPHFLYNSLDMINWLSLAGESDKVTQAIHALSRFYKLSLSKKDTLGTVEKELEHVTLYVQLQNMRFENRVHFLIDVPDELLNQQMPKLTFQPIVENSILHGILEKPSKGGTITLTGWREGRDIVFYIIDDGVGMEQALCDQLLSGVTPQSDRTSIGVYNTHCRLRLFYGEGYGLRYESKLGEGTQTELRLPAK